MMSLKKLRVLIALSWIVYLCQVLVVQFYDPSLYSPLIYISKNMINRMINLDYTIYFFLVFEAVFLIYGSAALWLGFKSGKWAYSIYILFAIFDNYLLPVQAFSSLDMALQGLAYILLGMILLAIYTSPLKEEFAAKKSISFWKTFILFFIFFILFFALPLSFSYFL